MYLYLEDGKTVIDGTGCMVFKDAKLGCVELGEGVENMVISKFDITNVNSCSGLLRWKGAFKNAKRVFLFTIRAKQNKHVNAIHVKCPSGPIGCNLMSYHNSYLDLECFTLEGTPCPKLK